MQKSTSNCVQLYFCPQTSNCTSSIVYFFNLWIFPSCSLLLSTSVQHSPNNSWHGKGATEDIAASPDSIKSNLARILTNSLCIGIFPVKTKRASYNSCCGGCILFPCSSNLFSLKTLASISCVLVSSSSSSISSFSFVFLRYFLQRYFRCFLELASLISSQLFLFCHAFKVT